MRPCMLSIPSCCGVCAGPDAQVVRSLLSLVLLTTPTPAPASAVDGPATTITTTTTTATTITPHTARPALHSPPPPPNTHRAQRERLLSVTAAQQQQEEQQQPGGGGNSNSSKTYKGMNAYVDYKAGLRREGHTVGAEKGSGSHGPLRGNVFVRSTARLVHCVLGVGGQVLTQQGQTEGCRTSAWPREGRRGLKSSAGASGHRVMGSRRDSLR